MPEIDLVLNPHARRLRAGGALRRAIVQDAARVGARVHEPATLAEMEQLARALADRSARLVLFAGGDGSAMRGVSALATAFGRATLPVVGLISAGTVGTVARNLGFAHATVASLADAAVDPARTTPWPTLRVRDDVSGARVGFIFGAGLVGRFFDAYHRSRRQGNAAAAIIAARVFAGSFVGSSFAKDVLSPAPCTLTVDGHTHEASAWSLVVASVLRDVGLHFRVTYRAGDPSGGFHVVASGLPPKALGPQMPLVLAGKPLRGEPRVDALACTLRVDFREPSGTYVLDGDVFRAPIVNVEAGPVLRLLRPA